MSITATRAAAAAATGAKDQLDLGPYFIQQLNPTRYVLDVDNFATGEGTQVIAWTRKTEKENNLNQQWQFVPAGAQNPGWWYLQSNMGTGFVMSLQPRTEVLPTPVVMRAKGATDDDRQLWCLQSTEKLGYWYIQSKYQASNSQTPLVIALSGDMQDAYAVAAPISFTEFKKQAWGFAPVNAL